MVPRSFRLVAAAAVVVGLAAPPAAQSRGFSLGVSSSEVTATTAVVWTRADRPGDVVLEWARRADFRHAHHHRLRVSRITDDTIQTPIRHLQPNTAYFFRFRRGAQRSAVGTFRTAPSATSTAPVRFGWSGDADAQPAKGKTRPAFNRFEVYRRMALEHNSFNVNLGDTIYSDSEAGGPTALTLGAKRAKYRQNLALANLQLLRRTGSVYNQWDDHEFVNDFTFAENGAAVFSAGVQAFRDYMPVTYTPQSGTYRVFHWGRNLDVFFLDERSFRDAKASAGHVCDNPDTNQPDLAPTAPQQVRQSFAMLIPSLAQPVAQACLDAIRDPNRHLLGDTQLTVFLNAIKASTATFKVVMNEVPIQQFYALPYDRWEGYEAERQRVLTFLRDNVRNAIFLTTDTHANFVNDARLDTFGPGGPINSGISEVITGPVATGTFAQEIDQATGRPGAGNLISGLFFKPAPPNGLGMPCAAPDVFSYGEVTVTTTRLTVRLKDLNGAPVEDVRSAQACAPVVLTAR